MSRAVTSNAMAIGSIHGWHHWRAVGTSGNDALLRRKRMGPARPGPVLLKRPSGSAYIGWNSLRRCVEICECAGVGAPAEIGATPAGGVAALGIVEAMASLPVNSPV